MHRRPHLRPLPAGRRAAAAALAAALVTAASLASCSSTPQLTAAPFASAPACVPALAALPGTVLDQPRTPIDVAGAASWGEPPVVLRCGLAALAPTTTPCQTVNDIDWVFDTSGDPMVATTYGRAPAVELRVPASYGAQGLSAAMVDVAAVAAALPRNGRDCTDLAGV